MRTAAPTIPGTRRLLYVNSALVLIIGIPRYLLPAQTDRYFAWTIVGPDPRGRPGRAAVLDPDAGHHPGACRPLPLPQPAAHHPGHAAAAADVGFLATILLLGGYGWWKTRRHGGAGPTFDDHPA